MERHVGELDMHQFQQRHTFIICWFSFVFDRRREASKWCRRRGFSETHSQLNMWEVCLWRKRKQMPEIVKSIRKLFPSHILMITPSKHRCDHLPTFLHCDSGCLSRQSAQEGWVVRKTVYEIRQDHPVAVGLQLLNRAFAFEFVIRRWSRDIGADDRFFGAGGPREVKGADLVGLRFKQTVYSQVFVIFSAQGDFVALCWDQQNCDKKKYKTHQHVKKKVMSSVIYQRRLFFHTSLPPSTPYTSSDLSMMKTHPSNCKENRWCRLKGLYVQSHLQQISISLKRHCSNGHFVLSTSANLFVFRCFSKTSSGNQSFILLKWKFSLCFPKQEYSLKKAAKQKMLKEILYMFIYLKNYLKVF